jgi:hypothetical protein
VIKVLRREGYAEYVFMCRRIYLFLTTRRSLRRGFVSFFRFAKRRSFVLLRERDDEKETVVKVFENFPLLSRAL